MSQFLKIGVGGSAANPPTIGHRALIRALLFCGFFDLIIWRVSGSRRDKNVTTSADDLAQMTNLMLPKNWFTLPTKLIVQFNDVYWENTPAIIMLDELAERYPGAKITWFTGADSIVPQIKYRGWSEIEACWLRGEELIAKWPFLIIPRQGYSRPKNLPANFSILPVKLPNVSSSQVRKLIARGKPFEHLLTPAVAKYVKRWRLYGYNSR
ncbi:MAG: nicotinate-nicotinamide nucleotide adenylyltransferase [Patescibacteria group bacterium]